MSTDVSIESRTNETISNGSSQSTTTIHYAKPVHHCVKMDNKNVLQSPKISTSSSSASTTPRSPNIRYPTVVVNNNSSLPGSPKSSAYAVPTPRNMNSQYSPIQLQYEHIRHRCKMLDEENQKLMKMQSDIVSDANRRVQMHINEIRMLKEENRKIQSAQKELRDLACFLDDDRQKTKKLAREWQKFGRYTSNLMKQEIQTYHQKLTTLEEKLSGKEHEAEELRQLCMYLDEQRQCLMNSANNAAQHLNFSQSLRSDDESEDLGCGSSEQSGDNGHILPPDFNIYNKLKESKLRLISEQMITSQNSSEESENIRKEESRREKTRLLDCDERTIIERSWNVDEEEETESEKRKNEEEEEEDSLTLKNDIKPKMLTSMTNSDCTTYASSGTDMDSVYVMGDEISEHCGNLEVRTLSRIEEESEIMRESAKMPPKIAPVVCGSILSPFENPLMRSFSESASPQKKPMIIPVKGSVRCSSMEIKNM
ncbi:unnamed protein product [Caenorhabditis angaria]|uniref:Uncharacterized protein n=1 Tax=Caenorhabditis angaria TaxID=860376 RepID=A0A9P1N8C8_9PELO|nr:unnamed protein product [Caenorhabditis angaria]